jgi:hypothetical protein
LYNSPASGKVDAGLFLHGVKRGENFCLSSIAVNIGRNYPIH